MTPKHILLVKETKAGEQRVALIPDQVAQVVQAQHHVYVETGAGVAAGFTNAEYKKAGAQIRNGPLAEIFASIDIIVRAKRPDVRRESQEIHLMSPGSIMIGALDFLEKGAEHIKKYHQAGIVACSIDQLEVPANDPINILHPMSQLAGTLCVRDALTKAQRVVTNVIIIGFGSVGQAAFAEAQSQRFTTTVMLRNRAQAKQIQAQGGAVILFDQDATVYAMQQQIADTVISADMVISSVRRANQPAPVLLSTATLHRMQQGAVVVDMALSEGGNVEGSEHDQTYLFGNGVLVNNVSGYPKVLPKEASVIWSKATYTILMRLFTTGALPLKPC